MNIHLPAGRLLLLALALFFLGAIPAALLAQEPGGQPAAAAGYGLSWYSVDGGGTLLSNGGAYTLAGTAGQADARRMIGGPYHLVGGFWAGLGSAPSYRVYLPLVLR